MLWGTLEGWRQGSSRTPETFEGSSCYQNIVGADSLKSALERLDHAPRAEHTDSINVASHQGRSTNQSAPLLKGTHPYSCFVGDPTDKSRASPSVVRRERARKLPLRGRENFLHLGAIHPLEQRDLCSNVPWVEGKHSNDTGAITLPTSWFGGRYPIRGVTHLNFCKKCV